MQKKIGNRILLVCLIVLFSWHAYSREYPLIVIQGLTGCVGLGLVTLEGQNIKGCINDYRRARKNIDLFDQSGNGDIVHRLMGENSELLQKQCLAYLISLDDRHKARMWLGFHLFVMATGLALVPLAGYGIYSEWKIKN